MAAGDAVLITKPWFYLADLYPTAPALPALTVALRGNWPAAYNRLKGFQNGVTVTVQKPMAAIQTSDLGIVGYVSTGAHGIQIQSQFRLPTENLLERLSSFYTVSKVATPPYPAVDVLNFDPNDEFGTNPVSEFRTGIEGVAAAGTLYATQRTVRFIGFRCQQGGNVALRHDHSGNDAGVFPTMTAQLLPYTVTAGEVTNTGLALADIKSDKGIWLNIA